MGLYGPLKWAFSSPVRPKYSTAVGGGGRAQPDKAASTVASESSVVDGQRMIAWFARGVLRLRLGIGGLAWSCAVG